MMKKILAMLTVALALSLPAGAQELTPDEVKRLALEAILENPEIVMEAVAILREREEADQAAATEAALAELMPMLESDPNAPVLGNPEGNLTVVEFFDYNCPYCKQAAGEIKALIAEDSEIRLVYREWPILGDGSVYAARAALAARVQGKYEEFHWALMEDRARKEETSVLEIAASIGLDIERLKADMESEAVTSHIAQSMAMAQSLGFSGTPSFVIGGRPVFGFLPKDELAAIVTDQRAKPPGE